MVRKMSDDEVMDFVHNKMFNDLDGLESSHLFDEGKDEGDVEGTAPNAKPESSNSGGVKITIEPLMEAGRESGKPEAGDDDREDAEEDRLKGIGGMSPLMAQLHGER
jgi:hypothetical protein